MFKQTQELAGNALLNIREIYFNGKIEKFINFDLLKKL
jgi:hypothetical protein